jgi:hypothetical protein
MKTRTFCVSIILLFTVTFLFAEDVQREISDEDFIEAFSGTWVNSEYSGGLWPVKYIIQPNGSWEWHTHETITSISYYGTTSISEKWIDADGNIWYSCRLSCEKCPQDAYEINKISNSGNTRELLFSLSRELTYEDWQTGEFKYNYRIYYRQ